MSDKPAEGWGVYEPDDGYVHVAPIFGRPHVMSLGCWCLPELDPDERMLVVHHEAEG